MKIELSDKTIGTIVNALRSIIQYENNEAEVEDDLDKDAIARYESALQELTSKVLNSFHEEQAIRLKGMGFKV